MKNSKWEKESIDSGFSSDTERIKNRPGSSMRQRKAKSLYLENDEALKKLYESEKLNSLPSSFQVLIPINWNEVSLADFDHVRYLGGGGYSRVDLIEYNRPRRKAYFALKKINKNLLGDATQAKHFEAEKEILCLAKSRFIPRLFKTFCSSNHIFLLTEACLGGDLFSYLERCGSVDVSVARFIVGCVIEALDYLHRILRVIHRDVKTENLLIGHLGTLKLADFGFCKGLEAGQKHTYTFCGTPGYIAPEVILRNGYSYSADYFSLGVVTYEILSCRSPFRRHAVLDTYKATLKGIADIAFPSHLDHVTRFFIKGLCHREPERRMSIEARTHRWFNGFNWHELRSGEMSSPLLT